MKTKRIFSFLVAVLAVMTTYAASPNLQDVTLKSSNGETLDFYADRSNKVVYAAPGTGNSRGGTFYVGSTIRSSSGNVEARFSIELPMSYGIKTLSGTIYYRSSDGFVYNVTLDGTMFSRGSRTVVPRRRYFVNQEL